MIRKANRFHGYGSVRAVQARGKTVRGGAINLRYATRSSDRPYRIAVVVSRKVSKSAVTRNRIRRRIFELLRTTQQPSPGSDLVFLVYADSVATLPSEELQVLITDLLNKTK